MANLVLKCSCLRDNLRRKVLKPVLCAYPSKRTYASSIYIPGNKANKTNAYITSDIDFDCRFNDPEKLQKELNLRASKIDIGDLQKLWKYYKCIHSDRVTLEGKHSEISGKVFNLKNKGELTAEEKLEVEGLITQSRLVKQDLKVIKESVWDMEDNVIPRLLKLPNEIDERTPEDESRVLKTVGEKPEVSADKRKSHLDIGKNLNLIDYRNPIQCYLCNEAVSFELGVLSLASDILNNNKVTRVAGPDFCRSIAVEGSGIDHENPTESFILQNMDDIEKEFLVNRLHLVGGASLPALLALYTKLMIRAQVFPIKIFTTGRQYTPIPQSPIPHGLFSVCQASAVQALTLMRKEGSESYTTEFESLVDATSEIYDSLGCHYRVVIRSARELNPWESLRISFEMWSVHSNRYIEVGHVSPCGDYFSKRLMIGSNTSVDVNYATAITGTLLSVPRVLGCLIEENPDKFVLPEKVKEFSY